MPYFFMITKIHFWFCTKKTYYNKKIKRFPKRNIEKQENQLFFQLIVVTVISRKLELKLYYEL